MMYKRSKEMGAIISAIIISETTLEELNKAQFKFRQMFFSTWCPNVTNRQEMKVISIAYKIKLSV